MFLPFMEPEELEEYKKWYSLLERGKDSDDVIGHIIVLLTDYIYGCPSPYEYKWEDIVRNKRMALQKIEETVERWKDKESFRYAYLITRAQCSLLLGDFESAEAYYEKVLELPQVRSYSTTRKTMLGEYAMAVTIAHNLANLYYYEGKKEQAERCIREYKWMVDAEEECCRRYYKDAADGFLYFKPYFDTLRSFTDSDVIYIDSESITDYLEDNSKTIEHACNLITSKRLTIAEFSPGRLSFGYDMQETNEWFHYLDATISLKNTSKLKRDKLEGNDVFFTYRQSLEQTLFRKLNALVGLNSIKDDVRSLVNLVRVQERKKRMGIKTVPLSLHLVFSGNPGTGKTTVARILAEIYREIGILSEGHLVEVDRSGLVAGYVGQTALKTRDRIMDAMGGVLFIDEAYTLAREKDDYGREAIDTLLKEMEDHRGDFIVIVAGYSDLMKDFINSNPGLKSRFNKYIHFPDYSAEELVEIFYNLCKEYEYTLSSGAQERMKESIYEMESNKDENFANARDVRNLFERVITKQSSRVISGPSEDMMIIIEEDFE